jgi:hypothetical protein
MYYVKQSKENTLEPNVYIPKIQTNYTLEPNT